jgi:hypothetical protein
MVNGRVADPPLPKKAETGFKAGIGELVEIAVGLLVF